MNRINNKINIKVVVKKLYYIGFKWSLNYTQSVYQVNITMKLSQFQPYIRGEGKGGATTQGYAPLSVQ